VNVNFRAVYPYENCLQNFGWFNGPGAKQARTDSQFEFGHSNIQSGRAKAIYFFNSGRKKILCATSTSTAVPFLRLNYDDPQVSHCNILYNGISIVLS